MKRPGDAAPHVRGWGYGGCHGRASGVAFIANHKVTTGVSLLVGLTALILAVIIMTNGKGKQGMHTRTPKGSRWSEGLPYHVGSISWKLDC